MQASEVMTRNVVTVREEMPLVDAVKLMLERHISGFPVVDNKGAVIGIVTEGDLLRRCEVGTERKRLRWLEFLVGPGRLAEEYVHAHGKLVRDVMTTKPVTVSSSTPLAELVSLMEKKRIKRLPVIDDGRLVGIISRANLAEVLLSVASSIPSGSQSDEEIRQALWSTVDKEPWAARGMLNLYVRDGVVHLVGAVTDPRQRDALIVAAKNIPGVRDVCDNLVWCDYYSGAVVEIPENSR